MSRMGRAGLGNSSRIRAAARVGPLVELSCRRLLRATFIDTVNPSSNLRNEHEEPLRPPILLQDSARD